MTIAELIRQESYILRDQIKDIETKVMEARSQKQSAEEIVKRITTKITGFKQISQERKKEIQEISDDIANIQHEIEDLEIKRRIALDRLFELQNEHTIKENERRQANDEIDRTLGEMRREETERQEAERRIKKILEKKQEQEKNIYAVYMSCLSKYLNQQEARIKSAFASGEERRKNIEILRDFNEKRNKDLVLAQLYEEREELKRLLENSTVPGVKSLIRKNIADKERDIEVDFPGIFSIDKANASDCLIEELLFYCDSDGKVIMFIPCCINSLNQKDSDSISDQLSISACVIWNMVRGLGVRFEDGVFVEREGRLLFKSTYDLETVASQSFCVKKENVEIVSFVLTAVPQEVQEALNNENKSY